MRHPRLQLLASQVWLTNEGFSLHEYLFFDFSSELGSSLGSIAEKHNVCSKNHFERQKMVRW